MDLEPLLWIIFFLMNMGLIALNLYQIVSLSDLEADYLNPYESSSRINHVVIPEYLLHGAFSILFLLSGHWFFFLATLPAAYINLRKFMKREHLIDVTEVFRVLSVEKKLRVVKLGFYLLLFVLVMTRLVFVTINSAVDESEATHLFGLF
ncbi:protein cornichon homolog 1-like isoform X2 [Coffea arabica]|uniref:Protein cornichon homolog 1-like isoform X2 n=1 Tax=Coffea arabica TaxID=13443 RepID=A0A6P6SLB4_COFAR|nr:protein cornichon homolog 1-like isoform X2 [Coffea arabica]